MELNELMKGIEETIEEHVAQMKKLDARQKELAGIVERASNEMETITKDSAQILNRVTLLRNTLEAMKGATKPVKYKPMIVPHTPKPSGATRGRRGRRIVKLDAGGNEIGSFKSIKECASALGWSAPATKKYLEYPVDKQIYLKGYVLCYEESEK